MNKTIESFCCHEKALEYDEYDGTLTPAQDHVYLLHHCVSCLPSFVRNMLSQDVRG